ncbi:MAG: transposase [Mesorhizobium sp.]|nr:MAG: transposase [Mesorhizobium sp.]TGS61880.1 transposase [Mesorhizobium sp. M3A.F.Ca.ET.201.01.1.1]RWG59012.1 MAG: transposase [Mesorhizobium sp.]RWH47354.1 MAG: transposase [Mesorhizobium sp.]RWH79764.1 MAG: transposase [Mesorhizobium sp.]
MVSGILFAIRNGLRWRDGPASCGPHKTIQNRFIHWSILGMFTASWPKLAARGDDPVLGAKWLTRQILPADERAAIERHLGLISQINEALRVVEPDIAVHALQDPTIRRLMTLPAST